MDKAFEEIENVYVIDTCYNKRDELICIYFPAEIKEADESYGGNKNGYAQFLCENKAEFGFHDKPEDTIEGTWEEIYRLVLRHINEKLTAPDFPKE